MDEEIRALQKHCSLNPDDVVMNERLQRALLRVGQDAWSIT